MFPHPLDSHCVPALCTHGADTPSLPSWSSLSRGLGGQGRQGCQAPLEGRCGETFMESAWGVRISARLLLGDQACYCLDRESRSVGGMGLVSEWAVPGPTPCTGAIGGSVEGKARAPIAACPTTLGANSFILVTWLDQYLEDSFQPPDFPCLEQRMAFTHSNLPGLDLECCVQLLQSQSQCQRQC